MPDGVDKTPEELHNELMKILLSTSEEMLSTMQNLSENIVGMLGKAGVEAGKSLTQNLSGGITNVEKMISGADIFGALPKQAKDKADQAWGALKEMKENLKGMEIEDLLIGLDLEKEDISQVLGSLEDINNKEFAVKIGGVLAVESIFSQIEKVTNKISAVEDNILRQSKAGMEALREMVPTEDASRSFRTLSDAVGTYRTELNQTRVALGVSEEAANEAFGAMAGEGVTLENLLRLQVNTNEGAEALTGLEAAMVASRATGLSMGQVAKQTSLLIRELGVDAADAGQHFERLANIQSGTSLKISEVQSAISSAQREMKFWGDTTEGASTIFKGFVNTLGQGRELLAQPLFDQVVRGVQQMQTGLRSFLGMTTQLGTGGAGALGGALEVEEALTTGRGLEDVLQGVQESVERLSGAPILTRREAVDTGQQQQFFIQRELLQQFLGQMGAQQSNLVMEALQQGDFSRVAEQVRPGGPGGGLAAGRAAEQFALEEGGPSSRLANKMSAVVDDMKSGVADSLVNSSKSFSEGTSKFEVVAEKLRGVMEQSPDELMETFKNFKDIVKTNRAIIEDQKAQEQVLKQRIEAGAGGLTPTGEEPSGEQLSARGKVREATGRRIGQEQATSAQVFSRTMMETMEKQSSLSEALSKTQLTTAESLNTVSQTFQTTGATLGSSLEQHTDAIKDFTLQINEGIRNLSEMASSAIKDQNREGGATEKEVVLTVRTEVDDAGNVNFTPLVKRLIDEEREGKVKVNAIQE